MSGESELGIDPAGETMKSFFEELGERDEVYGEAIMRVLAWQLEQARKKPTSPRLRWRR